MNSAQKDTDQTKAGVAAPFVMATARFAIGDVVRHKMFDFRGVVFDVDPIFSNDDDWYESIPADIHPDKNQPFYHLLAEGEDGSYTAYVSQGNLVLDGDAGPVHHPELKEFFDVVGDGRYTLKSIHKH